jgi:hypothetical protein
MRSSPMEAKLDMLLLAADTLLFSNRRSRRSEYLILFRASYYPSFYKKKINHMFRR